MEQHEREFLIVVAVCALICCALFVQDVREHFAVQAALNAPAGGAGKPRDADIEKIMRLIRQNELSGHEALFYKAAPAQPPPAAPQSP